MLASFVWMQIFSTLCVVAGISIITVGHAQAVTECQQLWIQRNSVFKARGYCFNTPRAIAYFGNAGCTYTNQDLVPLSDSERVQVLALRQRQRVLACPPDPGPIPTQTTTVSASPGIGQVGTKVPMISMTAEQLRSAGIAVRSAGAIPLPHSCATTGATDLSVSNDMLSAFQSRGFTLESLCVSLSSAFRFDPESGKPMPFASLPKGQAVPLNLPDCFKRAVPFLDCSWRNDHYYGGVISQGERDQNRKIGQAIDRVARRQIQTMRGGRIVRPHDSNCGERMNAFDIQVDGRSICVILETVLLSESLPLGYGYALASPEGNDPEVEKVNLQTYGKKSGVVPIWNNAGK